EVRPVHAPAHHRHGALGDVEVRGEQLVGGHRHGLPEVFAPWWCHRHVRSGRCTTVAPVSSTASRKPQSSDVSWGHASVPGTGNPPTCWARAVRTRNVTGM